jgi:hypothetical protein
MDALPRHTLTRIVAKHGRSICNEPQRVEALLRDLCGAHKREINILIGAIEERVAKDLISAGKSIPREVLLAQLTGRLQDNLGYTLEAAQWAVRSWAVAVGVLSEAEFNAVKNIQPTSDIRAPRLSQQRPSQSASDDTYNRKSPQGLTASAPSRKPPTPPNIVANPSLTIKTSTAPRPTHTKITTPTNTPINTHAQPLYTSPPPQRNRKLRGCLISVLLLAVLIFGGIIVAPAIITLLREEQSQPSINDPRIP